MERASSAESGGRVSDAQVMAGDDQALAVEMTGISKSFFGQMAVSDVDFDVRSGEVHALLGENGAGKSVLCSILAGLYHADHGAIKINGKPVAFRSPHDALEAHVGMVYQEFRLVDELTVAENVVLGDPRHTGRLKWREVEDAVGAAASRYEIDTDPTALVRDLSVGERQRVEILKLLYRDVRVLILDEPTSVLTPGEVRELFAAVDAFRRSGRAVVLISHKINELRESADRVTIMRHGKKVATENIAEVTNDDLARLMVGREIPPPRARQSQPTETRAVLEISGLTVIGDDGRVAIDSFDVEVHAGEILGIAGIAGNGQPELAEAIAGLRPVRSGTIRVRRSLDDPSATDVAKLSARDRIQIGVAHIPEDRRTMGVAPGLDVAANLVLKSYWERPLSRRGIMSSDAAREHEDRLRLEYDIRGGARKLPVSILSGGNMQKVIVARELSKSPPVVIASYPTRGLDLGAVANVRDILVRHVDAGGAVVLISEDLDELFAMSDRIVVIHAGRITGRFSHGDYDREVVGVLMAGGTAPESNGRA
jgi:simple sugar transport system ATP-binding protein